LDNAEFGGRFTFTSGTSGYNNISDKPDIAGQIAAASTTLMTYINGAFSDGIISEAEALQIELYLNVLSAEKANVDSSYTTLYGDILLTGTAKTNLYNAKTALNSAYTTLTNYIGTAIADSLISSGEKANVDYYYSLYRNALSTYSQRYEEAHQFITTSVNNKAASALSAAQDASTDANIAAGIANAAAKVFYSLSAPVSGMRVNDLWVDGIEIRRWNGASWVFVSEYDGTETTINKGLIATGALIVGTSSSNGEGGMAGSGTIRLWCGGTVASWGPGSTAPGLATFTVDNVGTVRSKKAFIVHDANGTESAGFTSVGSSDSMGSGLTGMMQNPSSLRFWIGGGYMNPAISSVQMYCGGLVKMMGMVINTNPAAFPANEYADGIMARGSIMAINNKIGVYRDRPALTIRGGLQHFDTDVAVDTLDIGAIPLDMTRSNVFCFIGTQTRTRTLPTQAALSAIYGSWIVNDASIELILIQHTGSSYTTTIHGTVDGVLLNNNGGYLNPTVTYPYGQIVLSSGNCLTLRYWAGGWYVMSLRT